MVVLISLLILALYSEREKDEYLINENHSSTVEQEEENKISITPEITTQETEKVEEVQEIEDVEIVEKPVEEPIDEVVDKKEKPKVTNKQPAIQNESKTSNSESSNTTKDNSNKTTENTKEKNEERVENNIKNDTKDEEINQNQETTEESKNNDKSQEEKANETPKCNHDNEKNKWFNSKKEAEAIYYAELEKWDEFVRHDNVTVEEYMEYINNCPTGYEVWSCPYCQKWTINMYYKK